MENGADGLDGDDGLEGDLGEDFGELLGGRLFVIPLTFIFGAFEAEKRVKYKFCNHKKYDFHLFQIFHIEDRFSRRFAPEFTLEVFFFQYITIPMCNVVNVR